MGKVNSLEKTLMLGKIEAKRRRGWQRMKWLDSNTNSTDLNLSNLREIVEDRRSWGAAVHGVANNQTWFSNWTKTAIRLWKELDKILPDAKTDDPELSVPRYTASPNLSHPDIVIMPPTGLATHLPNVDRHLLEHHPAPDPWIRSRMATPRNKCLTEPTIPELPKWKWFTWKNNTE